MSNSQNIMIFVEKMIKNDAKKSVYFSFFSFLNYIKNM
jgi:hypothetical protein